MSKAIGTRESALSSIEEAIDCIGGTLAKKMAIYHRITTAPIFGTSKIRDYRHQFATTHRCTDIKKTRWILRIPHSTGLLVLVEVPGFEPGAFWSRTKRATKLRYTSVEPIKGLEPLTCGLRNRCSTS